MYYLSAGFDSLKHAQIDDDPSAEQGQGHFPADVSNFFDAVRHLQYLHAGRRKVSVRRKLLFFKKMTEIFAQMNKYFDSKFFRNHIHTHTSA